MALTAEQLAQLDEDEISFLARQPGLGQGDTSLLDRALEIKRSTPERNAKVQSRYEETKLRPPTFKSSDLMLGQAPANIGRQANATAAAAIEGVGAGPWIEAGGELVTRGIAGLLGRFRPKLPAGPEYERAAADVEDQARRQLREDLPFQPGYFQRQIESAPAPNLAKVTGAVLPAAAGATGANAVAQGARTVMEPVTRTFRALAGPRPGLMRTIGASGGTSGALAGSTALARRVPDIATGQPVEPLDVGGEIVAPTALGAAAGVLPGAVEWANRGDTRIGQLASRSAADRRSGAYQRGDLANLPRGDFGIQEARRLGSERTAEAGRSGQELVTESQRQVQDRATDVRQGSQDRTAAARDVAQTEYQLRKPGVDLPVEQAGAGATGELDRRMAGRANRLEMERGQAAAEIEPRVYQRFVELRRFVNNKLSSALDRAEAEGRSFNFDGFLRDIRTVVAREARPDTAGLSTPSQPEAPGSAEVHTPYGQRLQAIEGAAREYLPEGKPATVRQVRNFIKYLKTVAESGTPEKAFPAKQILGAARARLAEQDPEIGDALAAWKAGTEELEAASKRLYGSGDTHQYGIMDPQDVVDAPEAGAPYVPAKLDPARIEYARKYLMGIGRTSASEAARAPDRPGLAMSGFGPELDEMASRNAALDQRAVADTRQLATSKQVIEADVAAEKARQSRRLMHQTRRPVREAQVAARAEARQVRQAGRQQVDEAKAQKREMVSDAEAAARDLELSKTAQEAARFPGPRKLLRAGLLTALGTTSKSPAHGAVLAGEGALSFSEAAGTPIASEIAYRLPPPEIMRQTIPAGVALSQRERRRRRPEDIAASLVEGARSVYGQAGRLKASLADLAKYR
jgi:hypothetical protein